MTKGCNILDNIPLVPSAHHVLHILHITIIRERPELAYISRICHSRSETCLKTYTNEQSLHCHSIIFNNICKFTRVNVYMDILCMQYNNPCVDDGITFAIAYHYPIKMCVNKHVCMFSMMYMVCLYIYVYIYICVYIYIIYIHTHIHIRTHRHIS
jgi:hypothetical protein